MRSITSSKPQFLFIERADSHVVQQYHNKYNQIDRLLEKNPKLIQLAHDDLAQNMNSLKGRNCAYSSEMLFRMLLIKCIEQLSFRDLVIRVNDSMFLRNFARIGWGEVMGYALLDAAWKCIEDSTWDKINSVLFEHAKNVNLITGSDFRIDSTVCESNIHYSTDSSLLWDSYRVLARILRRCQSIQEAMGVQFRFHDKKTKRLHTLISTRSGNKNKSTQRLVGKSIKTLIERVDTALQHGWSVVEYLEANQIANGVLKELPLLLQNVEHVINQARRSQLNGETVPASERIFSIFEDHTELHKRGKAQKPVEFGHLITIGQTREKFISYYAVNEISKHDTSYKEIALENHKTQFGEYPSHFAADKNYHLSEEDTALWQNRIDVYAVGKKGKRTASEKQYEHSDIFRDLQRFRAGCEGSISVLKRVFGLKRCLYRGFKSFASSICRLVFCHNLVLLATG